MAALSASPRPDRETIRQISRATFERSRERGGSAVSVRAYTRFRNGKPERVGAHQRDNPGGADGSVLLVMAPRRPGAPEGAGGKVTPLEGGGGMVNRGGSPSPSPLRRNEPAAPAGTGTTAQPRPERLTDILAPGGQPIGTGHPRSNVNVRNLPGGDAAAVQMFDRLTVGRGGIDVTPPGYGGRMLQLADGSRIGYRPISRSGGPARDINIFNFTAVKRIHF